MAVPAAWPTLADYRAASVTDKASMRATMDADITAAQEAYDRASAAALAVTADDGPEALVAAMADLRAAMAYRDGLVAVRATYKGSAPVRTAPDYQAAMRTYVDTLLSAAWLIRSGQVRPAGIPDDVTFDDEAYVAARDEAPDGSLADADLAARIAGRSVITTRAAKAPLRRYLIEVTRDADKGTAWTVAELQAAVEALGHDYRPGNGAVVAALASKKGVPGLRYVRPDKARGIVAGAVKK